MSRYIDADSFFEEFEELDKEPYNNYPTADVRENVKGEWIFKHNSASIFCSVCDYEDTHHYKTELAVCPNCGADMRTD